MSLPQIGDRAPNFKSKAVFNTKVFDISLSDYINKYVILIFYPLDFTFVCPTELIAFSDQLNDFQEINANIIGCSVDSYLTHSKWLSMPHKDGGIRGLRFPLIADKSMAIARNYGVLDEEKGIAYRAMFIIDDKGIVRQITINDHSVGRCVPETIRLVKSIQQADKKREDTSTVISSETTPATTRKQRLIQSLEKCIMSDLLE